MTWSVCHTADQAENNKSRADMPVISFASSKGGAGKTTSTIVLGTELAQGTSVVMIDADPAARLFRWSQITNLPANVKVLKSEGEKSILDEIEDAASSAAFVLIDLEGSASRLASFAIGESDLVIIPSGEEQQDADAAIDTLAEVSREGRARRREVPAAVLFCRTNAAVKSRLEKHIHKQLDIATTVFETELHRRTAFSALHNAGAGLRQLDRSEFNGVPKAIENAQAFAVEVVDMLTEGKGASDAA